MKHSTINKEMLIMDIIDKHPESAKIMADSGMSCVSCHVAAFETLEEGAKSHGIDVNKIISKINKLVR